MKLHQEPKKASLRALPLLRMNELLSFKIMHIGERSAAYLIDVKKIPQHLLPGYSKGSQNQLPEASQPSGLGTAVGCNDIQALCCKMPPTPVFLNAACYCCLVCQLDHMLGCPSVCLPVCGSKSNELLTSSTCRRSLRICIFPMPFRESF